MVQLVRLLFYGANPNYQFRSHSYQTALHAATIADRHLYVQALVLNGANQYLSDLQS